MSARLTALFVLVLALTAFAQGPKRPLPAFAVASVKPFKPKGGWNRVAQYDPQRLTIEGMFPEQLVGEAYQLNDNQIVWDTQPIANELFTVAGTTLKPASKATMRLMLRRLLAARFHLTVRDTVRAQPVYNLEIARGGLKLQPAQSDRYCAGRSPDLVRLLHLPHASRIFFVGCSIADLVHVLNGAGSRQLRLPVLDKTGLSGRYDIVVWQATGGLQRDPSREGRSRPANIEPLAEAVSRLGLKLVKATGPYRVLTVTNFSEPTPN